MRQRPNEQPVDPANHRSLRGWRWLTQVSSCIPYEPAPSALMRNIEIELPRAAKLSQVEKSIDATLTAVGLQVSLRGTLKKFPGCTHWHARIPGQSGTLELTLWPQQHRAWMTIQSGRAAEWITEKLPEIQNALQRHLAAHKLPRSSSSTKERRRLHD